ncbi:MAG: DUF2752 domain-containing protein [Ignavibacterium sp.]|nr:MAG: DUF2752 domain-containing protein [Ignavibacterium sp.]
MKHYLRKASQLVQAIKYSLGLETALWIGGLLFLAFINNLADVHFTVCPIGNLGLDFCPGCGLGNSISYLFRGDVIGSFNSHPLGLFALIVLLIRIIHLLKFNRSRNGKYITTNALS